MIGWVNSGPSEEEAVCLECGGFSYGRRCEFCLRGYFNASQDEGTVVCQE